MGRLVSVYACPVCNYYVEDSLHVGGSGISQEFLRNRYQLAVCHDCRELVSVLAPNNDEEIAAALREARAALVQMEADAVIGDERARQMLPLFRAALDDFDALAPAAVPNCSICGGVHLEILDLRDEVLEGYEAWVHCPRCAEGQLLVETSGYWD